MRCNVGGVERIVRIVLGVMLVSLAVFGGVATAAAWVIGLLGAVALVTGAAGYCPAWMLLGINTCQSEPLEKKT